MSDTPSLPLPSSVWAAHATDEGHFDLVRMNPRTGAREGRVALPGANQDERGCLAVGAGAVWFVAEHARAFRVDPQTLRLTATIELGHRLGRPAVCAGALWVPSDRDGGRVLRIDPRTNTVTASVPLAYPRGLVCAGDAVWASHGTRVTRIDPRTLRTTATFDLGGFVHALAADGASVWAATLDETPLGAARGAREGGALFRVAEGLAQVTPAARIEGRAAGLCVGAGGLWLTAGALERFDPAQGALVRASDEALTSVVPVGARLWAVREDYARDATEVVALDPETGALSVLDADGLPVDLAAE